MISSYERRSWITLAILVVSLPALAWGALQACMSNDNDPLGWVPATFSARQDYDRFAQAFEGGDLLVASWNDCTLDDPRLTHFLDYLRTSADLLGPHQAPFLDHVVSGPETLDQLQSAELGLSRDALIRRFQDHLIGADGRTTAAIVIFTPLGRAHRKQAVARIRDWLDRNNVPLEDQHFAGPIINGLAVDESAEQSMRLFVPLSAAVVAVLAWFCLRSVRVVLLLFAVSGVAVLASLAAVYYSGQIMNAVLIVMPALVLVLGISGGIHLVNYIEHAFRQYEPEEAIRRAIALAWLPCAMATGTTAIGLASLVTSKLMPIRLFGIYATLGTLVTLALLFLLVPGAMLAWRRRGLADVVAMPAGDLASRRSRMTDWVLRHATAVSVLTIGATLVAGWGVPRVKTSVRIQTLLSPDSRVLQDYAWLEQHVAPLVPIEVSLEFPASNADSPTERLRICVAAEESLGSMPTVRSTMSAAAFLPDLLAGAGARDVARRAVADRRLQRHLPELETVHYVHVTPYTQQWRITARTEALNSLDYGMLLDDVRQQLAPLLAAHPQIQCTVTGIMPVVHEVQRALLGDLFRSFLGSAALITVAMMLIEHGIVRGALAMIPNVFPMVLLFGCLGWADVAVDIGSVMTASIALGMAIDGTVHYLNVYHGVRGRGNSPADACQTAFGHSARAMIQSTFICGAGICVFTFSSFVPIRAFAWLMLLLMAAALYGDLIFLPALITGPTRRWFERQPSTPQPSLESAAPEMAKESP